MLGVVNTCGEAGLENIINLPVLAFYGTKKGSTWEVPSSNVQQSCNSEYFEYNATTRQFLCKKSFSGNIYVISTGNMSRAGSGNFVAYTRWRLYIDDELYASRGSNTQNNTSRYDTFTSVTFTEGKYTYIHNYCYTTAANNKPGLGDVLYIVTL